MEKNYKRHYFPNFGVLNFKVDVNQLKKDFEIVANLNVQMNRFREIVGAKDYTSSHFPLETGGYRYFTLMELEPQAQFNKASDETLKKVKTESKVKQYIRGYDRSSEFYIHELDDRLYTHIHECVPSYTAQVLRSFRGQASRARYAVLRAGDEIQEHLDFNVDHSARIHIPIQTDSRCLFGVKRDGIWDQRSLDANGSVYFVNTAYAHRVMNASPVDRIHLIVNLNSQEDIEHLRLEGAKEAGCSAHFG